MRTMAKDTRRRLRLVDGIHTWRSTMAPEQQALQEGLVGALPVLLFRRSLAGFLIPTSLWQAYRGPLFAWAV